MQITLDGIDDVFFVGHPAAIDSLKYALADLRQERLRFLRGDKTTSEDFRFVEYFARIFIDTDVDQKDTILSQLSAFLHDIAINIADGFSMDKNVATGNELSELDLLADQLYNLAIFNHDRIFLSNTDLPGKLGSAHEQQFLEHSLVLRLGPLEITKMLQEWFNSTLLTRCPIWSFGSGNLPPDEQLVK